MTGAPVVSSSAAADAAASVVLTTAQACRVYGMINEASTFDQLEDARHALWADGYAKGIISAAEVTFLSAFLERRCGGQPRRQAAGLAHLVAPLVARVSNFKPGRRPLSPDREASRNRRRTVSRSGLLPHDLRCHYTEAECAALSVAALEFKRRGVCDLTLGAICAEAGVGRTSAQNAFREAQANGHVKVIKRPRRGMNSETNLIVIISPAWLNWLRLRGQTASSRSGFKSVAFPNTTEKKVSKKASGFGRKPRVRPDAGNARTVRAGEQPAERAAPA